MVGNSDIEQIESGELVACDPLEPGQDYVHVRFLPSNKVVRIARGATIFHAGFIARIPIPTTCQGMGACGRCRVRLLAPMGYPGYTEKQFLGPKKIARGIRLSCRVKVEHDLDVEVLPENL